MNWGPCTLVTPPWNRFFLPMGASEGVVRVQLSVNVAVCLGLNKKIPVFTVTRPTLIFSADSNLFMSMFFFNFAFTFSHNFKFLYSMTTQYFKMATIVCVSQACFSKHTCSSDRRFLTFNHDETFGKFAACSHSPKANADNLAGLV